MKKIMHIFFGRSPTLNLRFCFFFIKKGYFGLSESLGKFIALSNYIVIFKFFIFEY